MVSLLSTPSPSLSHSDIVRAIVIMLLRYAPLRHTTYTQCTALSSSSLIAAGAAASASASAPAPCYPPSLFTFLVRFATKKAGGSVKNKKDSAGRHLGLKAAGGQTVTKSRILVRQRGFSTHPGVNVGAGRDHTLFALTAGTVCFTYVSRPYRSHGKTRKFINVINTATGQTHADIIKDVEHRQAKYLKVLEMKRLGIRVPTPRSIYLSQKREQASQRLRSEKETLIQKYLNKHLPIPTQSATTQQQHHAQ